MKLFRHPNQGGKGRIGLAALWWLRVAALMAGASSTVAASAIDPVPTPWNGIDIGALKPAGEAKAENGTFTLTGRGKGIAGDADEFHLVYQTLSGDGSLTARVALAGSSGAGSQAGLMLRDALASASNFVGVVLSPGGVSSLHRSAYEPQMGVDSANAQGTLWLRLVKRGASVDAYFAPNANGAPGAWKKLGHSQPIASGMLYVGLCLSSHALEKSAAATFDHVALSSGAQPALDNGAYSIVPASAPKLTLSAAANGATVDIAAPNASPSQKWVFSSQGAGLYAIQPSSDRSLCLAVLGANAASGTKVVVEADHGLPSQRWLVIANANGTYGLAPQFAQGSGLDDFGGSTTPGTEIDIWQFLPNDQHTQWLIAPAP